MTSPSPTPGTRTRARQVLCAFAGVALVFAGAGPGLAAAPAPVPAPSHGMGPTAGDCQHLLQQFDVAWAAHRDALRADGARRSRDQGDADCRVGHYADGVHHLRRALHDIGLKPVKRVARVPTR